MSLVDVLLEFHIMSYLQQNRYFNLHPIYIFFFLSFDVEECAMDGQRGRTTCEHKFSENDHKTQFLPE